MAAARLAGASVAGHLVPGHRAALATAPPLLVAGIGSGFVILSNQTLTLAEIPPVAGGSAAGVPQAGQRIGSAVGIAAGGSVFFSTLTATHGDYARAFQDGLVIIIALVAVWRRYSPWMAVAITLLTLTTVGFAADTHLSTGALVFSAGLALLGVGLFVVILGLAATAIVEGRVSLFSRSRRMRRRLDELHGHFIVCTYGLDDTVDVSDYYRLAKMPTGTRAAAELRLAREAGHDAHRRRSALRRRDHGHDQGGSGHRAGSPGRLFLGRAVLRGPLAVRSGPAPGPGHAATAGRSGPQMWPDRQVQVSRTASISAIRHAATGQAKGP